MPRKMCSKSVSDLFADEGVGVEPEQLAFLVIGLAAFPVGPQDGVANDGTGDGCVLG